MLTIVTTTFSSLPHQSQYFAWFIAHPHLLVWATSEQFLLAWATFTAGLANESTVTTNVGTHRKLVACTSKCGWAIS